MKPELEELIRIVYRTNAPRVIEQLNTECREYGTTEEDITTLIVMLNTGPLGQLVRELNFKSEEEVKKYITLAGQETYGSRR